MKNFALLFRQPNYQYEPEKMKELGQKWQAWVTGIIEQGKLVDQGPRLAQRERCSKRVVSSQTVPLSKLRSASAASSSCAPLISTRRRHSHTAALPSMKAAASKVRPIMGPGK